MDNQKKIGSDSAKDAKFTETDTNVLNIIGKEPSVNSLNVPQSFNVLLPESDVPKVDEESSIDMSSTSWSTVKRKSKNIRKSNDSVSLVEKKRKKLGLQLDYFELKKKKLLLEVMELEKRLGVGLSEPVCIYYPECKTEQEVVIDYVDSDDIQLF